MSFGPFSDVSMNVRLKGGYFNETISCVNCILNINVFNIHLYSLCNNSSDINDDDDDDV